MYDYSIRSIRRRDFQPSPKLMSLKSQHILLAGAAIISLQRKGRAAVDITYLHIGYPERTCLLRGMLKESTSILDNGGLELLSPALEAQQ